MPGVPNVMSIKEIETMPNNSVELTYHCERCDVDTTRLVKADKK